MTVALTVTEAIGWALLGLLLVALLAAATVFDRTSWPSLVGDEATYLLAANSLARDLDLRYEPAEIERFRRSWRHQPDGLILQSPDAGRTLYYAKPLLYPAVIAPFVLVAPARGPFVANGLVLCAMGLLLAWGLKPVLHEAAPWWAAAFLFVSALPAYVFWAHPDLLLAGLSVAGLALVFGPAGAPHRERLRFASAGALLTLVALGRPWYVGLLAAGAVALPAAQIDGKRRRLLAYALGALLAATASIGLEFLGRGDWSSYSGERVSFSEETGFPSASGSAAEAAVWSGRVTEEGPGSWTAPGRRFPFPLTKELWGWNVVYFLVGRDVGLLPYFPSLLLLIVAASGRIGWGRWLLGAAFAFAAAGFLATRPFNFYGGGGAIANRYILPAIPALWFLCARSRSLIWAPVMALAAAPLLLPVWTAPTAFPFPARQGYPWVPSIAQRFLPYETTQSHLKPAGREDFVHRGLWIKPLTPGVEPANEGERMLMGGSDGAPVEFLVGRATPIGATLCYSTGADQPSRVFLHYQGRTARPEAGVPGAYRLTVGGPSASHPMWWTTDRWHLYRIEARADSGAAPSSAAWVELDADCRSPAFGHGLSP